MVNQISDCKFASSKTSASVREEILGAREGDVQLADVVANHAARVKRSTSRKGP